MEDVDLLVAIAGRDAVALRTLFDRHAPWLTARLSRRCGDRDLVDDALQDTFVEVCEGRIDMQAEATSLHICGGSRFGG